MNVYSLAEHEGMVVESEACHVKVSHILPIIVINVLEMKSRRSGNMKMQSSSRKVADKL